MGLFRQFCKLGLKLALLTQTYACVTHLKKYRNPYIRHEDYMTARCDYNLTAYTLIIVDKQDPNITILRRISWDSRHTGADIEGMGGICFLDFPNDNLHACFWRIIVCYIWWLVGHSGFQFFPRGTWINYYYWVITGDLPESIDVCHEETPWTVPESRRRYQSAPLLLRRIIFQFICSVTLPDARVLISCKNLKHKHALWK